MFNYEKPSANVIEFEANDDIITTSSCPAYVCVNMYSSGCSMNTFDCGGFDSDCTGEDAAP